jgi:hypothetical protein
MKFRVMVAKFLQQACQSGQAFLSPLAAAALSIPCHVSDPAVSMLDNQRLLPQDFEWVFACELPGIAPLLIKGNP